MNLRECEIYKGVHCYSVGAFDREQAIESFKEEFKNDTDMNKVRITRITSKETQSGDRIYAIFFRLNGSGISNRPNCVECGSENVTSHGKEWHCETCGRWFLKICRKDILKDKVKQWINQHKKEYEQYSQYIGEVLNDELLQACAEKFGITPQQVWNILLT